MTRNTSAVGTLSKRSRISVLAGSGRDKKKRDQDVEKKGNVSKVLVELEVPPGTTGVVEVSSSD